MSGATKSHCLCTK